MDVRSIRQPGWFWARNELLTEHGAELGPYGIAVYCALAMHADNEKQTARPGAERIAELIGCSVRKVKQTIKQLDALGLVCIEERYDDDGTRKSNRYWLLPMGDTVHQVHGTVHDVHGDRAPGAPELDSGTRQASIWKNVLSELSLQMTRATFDRWLAGSELVTLNGDSHAVVCVRDAYAVEWLSSRWVEPITRTLADVTNLSADDLTLEFTTTT